MTDLRWPWLALALGVLLVVLLARWARIQRRKRGLLVAHTARLKALPRYRQLARQEHLTAILCTVGALVLLTGTAVVAARPQKMLTTEPDRSGRDIVLCLDVSASMDRWNREVIASFRSIVDELNGERLALTIFSGAAVPVFPLTDDYTFIRRKLDEAEEAFATEDFDYFVGAETVEPRASQIGDGLVSCLERFGDPEPSDAGSDSGGGGSDSGGGDGGELDGDGDEGLDEEAAERVRPSDGRGRAVVLASDNDPLGRPVFTLPEAADQAIRQDAVVYGIATPSVLLRPEDAEEYRSAVRSTGGTLSVVQEDGTVPDIIAGIEQLERARLAPKPTGTMVDAPQAAFWVAVTGLVLLLGGVLRGRRS